MSSLGEEFPKEQARCREVLGVYRELGPSGSFAAHMVEAVLRLADEAAASGDVLAMLQAFEEMKKVTA